MVRKKTYKNKKNTTKYIKKSKLQSKNLRKSTKKIYFMKGCSKCKKKCLCGPNCNCHHNCPGNCYLNKKIKKGGQPTTGALKTLTVIRGGDKPIAPLSWRQMKGGNYISKSLVDNNNMIKTNFSIQHMPFHSQSIHTKPIRGGNYNYYDKDSRNVNLKGGNINYKNPTNIPGPFVGESWSGQIKNWSGVDGIGSNHNYLENNLYNKGDPQTSMNLDYSNNKPNFNLKGAGIIPQDLTNIGRMLQYNVGTAYNSINGYEKPINPMPYNDQFNSRYNSNVKIPM